MKSFEFSFDHLYRPLSEGIKGSVILLTRFAPLVSSLFFSLQSVTSPCMFITVCSSIHVGEGKGRLKKKIKKLKSCLVQCNFFLSETRSKC